MARNYNELRRKMSPERRARVDARVERTILALSQVRKARKMTQVGLASAMKTTQGEVSRIESQADMYLSTLRSYVSALGGELILRAQFPDGAGIDVERFGEPRPAAVDKAALKTHQVNVAAKLRRAGRREVAGFDAKSPKAAAVSRRRPVGHAK